MQKLREKQIQEKLAGLPGWIRDGDAIKKDWKFQDFDEAMQFINKLAKLAEAHNHHPELYNVYNRVSLRFTTHDAGGLTDKDFKIARAVDCIT